MKILITGANGLVGQHLIRLLVEEGKFEIHALGKGASRISYGKSSGVNYHSVDLTNFKKTEQIVDKLTPHIIVHAAAMSQPNECVAHPDQCWKVNVGATRSLLRSAERHKSYFIYISTDFVFDGEEGPYDETATPNPVNLYGESKLLAEEMVQCSRLHWCIIRTVLVYGNKVPGGRSNFVLWVKEKLEHGESIKVVNDQIRTPTYVEDLAKGILLAIMKHAKGIYHISGKDTCTPYELACIIAELTHTDKGLITPVDASMFPEPAKRPPKTGFLIAKAIKELGYVPNSLHEALRYMLERG
ncbi:MAG: SDR family oxidoreductase [Bacteroidota bacterium]|jgi:dTDP-4-dehydrorhamnose reductase